jgi:hypothetical protein
VPTEQKTDGYFSVIFKSSGNRRTRVEIVTI